MSYQATLSLEARKNLDRTDRTTCARIQQRLHELAEHPSNPRISKMLQGLEGIRSSRVGNWRILYLIQTEAEEILIAAIRPRGEAYRKL